MAAFGEVPANHLALPHHQIGDAPLCFDRDLVTFENGHDDRCMHVKRQRRGGTASAKRFISDRMTKKVKSRSTPLSRDRQVQKSFFTQAGAILDWMRGIAVVRGRTGGEISRQF